MVTITKHFNTALNKEEKDMDLIAELIIALVAFIIYFAWPYVAAAAIFIVTFVLAIPFLFGSLIVEIIKIKKNRKKDKKSELHTQK